MTGQYHQRFDTWAQDGQPRSPHTLYGPMPRRPRPLAIRWDWVFGAVLVVAVAALFYGLTTLRWGL